MHLRPYCIQPTKENWGNHRIDVTGISRGAIILKPCSWERNHWISDQCKQPLDKHFKKANNITFLHQCFNVDVTKMHTTFRKLCQLMILYLEVLPVLKPTWLPMFRPWMSITETFGLDTFTGISRRTNQPSGLYATKGTIVLPSALAIMSGKEERQMIFIFTYINLSVCSNVLNTRTRNVWMNNNYVHVCRYRAPIIIRASVIL